MAATGVLSDDELDEWTTVGEFIAARGVEVSRDRRHASSSSKCVCLSAEPLKEGVFRFDLQFRCEHLMIGVISADHFGHNPSGQSWNLIVHQGAWSLENVRLERSVWIEGKQRVLFSGGSQLQVEGPTGVELDGQRCTVTLDVDNGRMTVGIFDPDTGEQTGEDWVVEGFPADKFKKGVWPIATIFATGSCHSYPALGGMMTKSATKR